MTQSQVNAFLKQIEKANISAVMMSSRDIQTIRLMVINAGIEGLDSTHAARLRNYFQDFQVFNHLLGSMRLVQEHPLERVTIICMRDVIEKNLIRFYDDNKANMEDIDTFDELCGYLLTMVQQSDRVVSGTKISTN